jgi:hypothetical protein
MKAVLLIVILFLFNITGETQYSVQPTLPNIGLVQKEQLWNVIVTNSSPNTSGAILVLKLLNRISDDEVFNATTNHFQLEPGAKQLNAFALGPIQYVDHSASIKTLLPVGSYTACYVLISADGKETELARECTSFDVEPLSPPMLIFPEDSAVMQLLPRQFSWLPPSPSMLFSNLGFDVSITEIQPGQTAGEAIQNNLPILNSHVSAPFLSLPGSTQFETGKFYAWQVVARDGSQYAAKSEAWVFSLDTSKEEEINENGVYALLEERSAQAGLHHLDGNVLKLKYHSFDRLHEGKLIFFNSEGKIVDKVKHSISYGTNLIVLRLPNRFKSSQIYTVQISDKQDRTYSATFYKD